MKLSTKGWFLCSTTAALAIWACVQIDRIKNDRLVQTFELPNSTTVILHLVQRQFAGEYWVQYKVERNEKLVDEGCLGKGPLLTYRISEEKLNGASILCSELTPRMDLYCDTENDKYYFVGLNGGTQTSRPTR